MKNGKILVFALMVMLMVSFAFAAVSPVTTDAQLGKKDIDGGAKPVDDNEVETEDAEVDTEDGVSIEEQNQNKGEDLKEQLKNKIMEKVKIGQKELMSNVKLEEIEGKIKATLSNGKESLLKIMPSTASENAIRALSLHNCVEAEGCTIELKEVGTGNETKAAYEVKTEKQVKVLGLFKAKMQVEAQIDAENGEVIKTKKAWWSFLASEDSEQNTEAEDSNVETEAEEVEAEDETISDALPPSDEPTAEEVIDAK